MKIKEARQTQKYNTQKARERFWKMK